MTDRRADITSDTTADDITVLRGNSGSGSSTADTPRILKQRFILDEKLGSGGMGTVYRAKDLRKVEAQDRQPYVAIKVLNNDFRAHPDAFIALQREASKSQGIAHPNIVSIFDFDKDGDVPYMTMELLQGQELSSLLKEYPSGLPDAVIWPLVEGMCAGLKRAHEGGITHSDFKPGNVFVMRDGSAKILDFGIARAVRVHHYDGDDTVFDPSKLAALTPAFASREMLLGEVPEPSDDIYSLAVVIYLMLTGRHPYDRVRADEAAKQGLRPERVKRLTRRQWRTLSSALELERSKRPRSMDDVIAGLLRPSAARPWWIVGAAVTIAVGTVALWLGTSAVDRSTVARDTLIDAQLARIDRLLNDNEFDERWRHRLDEEVKALDALDATGDARGKARARVLDTLDRRIRAESDIDKSFALLHYADVQAGGRFDAGYATLEHREAESLRALTRSDRIDREWLDAVEARLRRFEQAFPHSTERAELELELGETYLAAIGRLLQAGDAARAEEMLTRAQPRVFDPDAFNGFEKKFDALHKSLARAQAEAARKSDAASVKAKLATLTKVDCQRADAAALGRQAATLKQRYPKDAASIASTLTDWIAQCVAEVGQLDQDRAMSLRQQALVAFGPVPRLTNLKLDPCAMRSLIGNGAADGHNGFCVDTLDGASSGPRLVVVGDAAQRFAIGRYEVSEADLAPFCAQTGRCNAAPDSDRAATGVGLELAAAYLDWLSQRSGQRYRLPTRAEWELAARAGQPDPDRNCQARVAGVSRGGQPRPATSGAQNELGLVNVFGNVREWVMDGELPLAMGGSFADPISACDIGAARRVSGAGDRSTGMRVVREVP
jgi:serine/threonine protein kinase